jgi:hypothetical protein
MISSPLSPVGATVRVPKATTTPSPKRLISQPATKIVTAGRESGKRTLTDVMEHDLDVKRKRLDEQRNAKAVQSRFFVGKAIAIPPSSPRDRTPIAGSSKTRQETSKENIPLFEESETAPQIEENFDPVTQEDGYISPPNFDELGDGDTETDFPNLSSPVRPHHDGDDGDFGVDPVSSPPISRRSDCQVTKAQLRAKVPMRAGPVRHLPLQRSDQQASDAKPKGPKSRNILSEDLTSEIDCSEDECRTIRDVDKTGIRELCSPTPEPLHQVAPMGNAIDDAMIDRVEETERLEAQAKLARCSAVSHGWSEKWSFCGTRDRSRLRVSPPSIFSASEL